MKMFMIAISYIYDITYECDVRRCGTTMRYDERERELGEDNSSAS